MTYFKNILLASALAVAAPVAASAATMVDIFADTPYTFVDILAPGGQVSWEFTVKEDFAISNFSLSATGTNSGTDLANVQFGFFGNVSNSLTVVGAGEARSGFGNLAGGNFVIGDIITIVVDDGVKDDVGVTLSFQTGPAGAPVPLPAAGLLLGSIMLAGGAAAARKKKKAV